MKIKKLREAAEDQNILADGKTNAEEVKDAIETDTDGEKTLSDADAKKVADEMNKAAAETNAAAGVINPSSSWDEENVPIKTKNRLISTLDLVYYHALRNKSLRTSSGLNVLVEGLPGGGKTGIITDWKELRGLTLFDMNVKSDKFDQLINGLPMRDITVTDSNRVAMVPSNELIKLKNSKNVVLFLDEYNRQTNGKIRASLLTLINEHKVVVGEETYYFNNILFTICAINPAVKQDLDAKQLNGAELSRFPWNLPGFDSDPAETHEYINTKATSTLGKLLKRKGKKLKANNKISADWHIMDDSNLPPVDFSKLVDEIEKMSDEERDKYFLDKGLIEVVRQMELADYIIRYPGFDFDHKKDLEALYRDQKTIFNKRLFSDAINSTDGNPDLFIYWLENASNLLDKNIKLMKEAVLSYKSVEKTDDEIKNEIVDMIDGDASDLFSAAVSGNDDTVEDELENAIDGILDDEGVEDSDIDEDDLGLEDDDDMFGSDDEELDAIGKAFDSKFKK